MKSGSPGPGLSFPSFPILGFNSQVTVALDFLRASSARAAASSSWCWATTWVKCTQLCAAWRFVHVDPSRLFSKIYLLNEHVFLYQCFKNATHMGVTVACLRDCALQCGSSLLLVCPLTITTTIELHVASVLQEDPQPQPFLHRCRPAGRRRHCCAPMRQSE